MHFCLFLVLQFSLIFLIIFHGDFLNPSTMASLQRHCHWLLFLGIFLCFLISYECEPLFGSLLASKKLFWAIILSPYTPLRSLLLESSSAIETTPLMANNLSLATYLYPLFFPLTAHL